MAFSHILTLGLVCFSVLAAGQQSSEILKATANDFLISKWKTWFSWFDHNKDGKVCFSDLETARSKFTKLHHMEGEEKRQAWDTLTNWWSEYLLWGKEEITEAEFLEKQNEAYKEDKAKFIERARKCEEIICQFVDTAHIGFITEEELVMLFKAGGHGNEELDKQFFAALEPVGGKIPMSRFIDMWTQYLTCDDQTKPDVIVKAFEGGI